MRQMVWKPELYKFTDCREFVEEFKIGSEDLILTNEFIYKQWFEPMKLKAAVMFQEAYGAGEPTDEMFEKIYQDMEQMGNHKRIIGIGGGTVLDLAKLMALEEGTPVEELFEHKRCPVKARQLILVPTTCGTGSEVTNISILAFTKKNVKMGLAETAMYADQAVLIPQLLEGLPYQFFATSSIDALIHAVESSLSPKATDYTLLFGYRAIEMILRGYQILVLKGPEARRELLEQFLTASNFAGLAFGTAGCGPVHAMSYPLGGTFHVAHGEANYAVFMGVMRKYMEIKPDGKLDRLNRHMAEILGCSHEEVYERMETLLDKIISKKTMREYGADEAMLRQWADDVINGQARLMANSFVPLNKEQVLEIYQELYR